MMPAVTIELVNRLEAALGGIPLAFLEVWGRFGYMIGFALAVCAFGGFTLRPAGRWGLGRERQAWDAKAVLSIPVTFLLILFSGYVGSFIVLVPGAQTFESLKDLFVFLCIVLFGYPALITVPFAYGLSDLIEGVPPEFLLDWLTGYFINPACFWVAYQILGKNPDFRRLRTWGGYLGFILFFLSIEPILWGYICSGKFTSEISYRSITPALFFTTGVTWVIAPFAMLGALPLARRFGLFWAEIPGHVQERKLGQKEHVWESGAGRSGSDVDTGGQSVPIRIFFLAPFVGLVLVLVGATAYVTLQEAEDAATRLAVRLHQEIAENINLQLDEYLAKSQQATDFAQPPGEVQALLASLPISKHGRAFIVDRTGSTVASSSHGDDPVVKRTIASLQQTLRGTLRLGADLQFHFDHVTAKPLSRKRWLAHAAAYQDRSGGHADWILVTAMPEVYYLGGVRAGQSRSAMVFAIALLVSLGLAALLASVVTAPLRRISLATRAFAGGDTLARLPGSRLEELDALARAFNDMAGRLKTSFDELLREVDMRKARERQLEESEALLRTSENRVQLAVKAAQLGIWDWDVVTNELVWDDQMYAIYNVSREGFAGTYDAWSRCLVPEDLVRAVEDMQAALRGEKESALEFRVRWADGSIRTVRGAAHVIRDQDGRPLRMVGINRDVTEMIRAEQELRRHRDHLEELVGERTQALERSEKRTQAILDNLAEAVITIDGDGIVRSFSLAATRIFGYAPEEVIGRNFAMLMPQPDASRQDGSIRRILALREARFTGIEREAVGRRKDGSEFPADLAIAEVSLGAERLFAGVVRDISERRRAEEALREAKEQADSANQAKSAFLANMSHEIRTPMNAVLGHAQLLLRDRSLSLQQKEQAETIYRSGSHLLTLINDILEMSKIEAGRVSLNIATFDLHALFDDVALMFRGQASEKGLALAIERAPGLPRVVAADSGKVRQVMINLLSNAVKFTATGRIDVRATCGPPSGDVVTVSVLVEDTGCGIEPERIGCIFDAFEQATAGARAGGTGLGMAISHTFARLMHGDLTVESAVDEGSRFTFTFQAGIGVQEAGIELSMPVPVGLMPSAERWRVLVIDDDKTNRDLLGGLLSGIGFDVRMAAGAASGIREHDTWRPHLVMMDLRMPRISGEEAIRRLRAAGSKAAIIAVTASAFMPDRAGAIRAGADAFLAKPYTHAALFAAVKEVLAVEYVYAEEETRRPPATAAAPASGALPKSLDGLPPGLVEALREATINARVSRLNSLIDQVHDHDPEAAAPLRRLVNAYQYETLLAVLDNGRRT